MRFVQFLFFRHALVKDKEYFVVTSNAEDHFVPAGFEADRVFEMEGKLTQMRCKNRCHDEVYPNQKAVLAMTEEEVNGEYPKSYCRNAQNAVEIWK